MGADVFNLRIEYGSLNDQKRRQPGDNALDQKTVFQIARLARIHVDDEHVDRYVSELSGIIDFVEQMNRIDTDNVAPLSHPQDRVLRMRGDEVTEENQRDQFQSVAPATENGLYLVPKVIE